MREIKSILVANRGEIALRIMKSAREMGIKVIAIYSEADRMSPHVRYADEAYCVGPPPSSQSYLLGEKIIELCKKNAIDAIHPGYGFLSENSDFAKKVEEAGITFIGPSAQSMEIMGSKLGAKNAVKKFQVPLVPGTESAIEDVQEAKKIAESIGFPVLVKASAGGGGKGMRIIHRLEEFEEQVQLAMNEAQSAFGDKSVFIEKYVSSPKHIEIQVLGDQYGNVVYLFERECSIQRRHQKVIEEAPSIAINEETRQKMGQAAVNVCKACNYYNAGTVEFIVDEKGNFYFLEMNTRLQVEHPVTEMITGIDLVKEQIKIAMGLPLSFKQEDLSIRGHAIEIRVYAEDPTNNFLPDIGNLIVYHRPLGPGIRVDDGYEEGMQVPIYYDPMLCKLIVHAPTRNEAIAKMIQAIEQFEIVGVKNTLDFCKFVLKHPHFIQGNFDTHFVQKHFQPEFLQLHLTDLEKNLVAYFSQELFENSTTQTCKETTTTIPNKSLWKMMRLK
jgi:propionyl-CoA carboxylase alpha chain